MLLARASILPAAGPTGATHKGPRLAVVAEVEHTSSTPVGQAAAAAVGQAAARAANCNAKAKEGSNADTPWPRLGRESHGRDLGGKATAGWRMGAESSLCLISSEVVSTHDGITIRHAAMEATSKSKHKQRNNK